MTPKIATCCYCGTRAALTLRGKERHELSCSTCGAPLHEMKMLRSDAVGGRDPVRYVPTHGRARRPIPQRKRKPRKSLKRRIAEELWDKAEDLFDLFD
jgi:hypothetical protein